MAVTYGGRYENCAGDVDVMLLKLIFCLNLICDLVYNWANALR